MRGGAFGVQSCIINEMDAEQWQEAESPYRFLRHHPC